MSRLTLDERSRGLGALARCEMSGIAPQQALSLLAQETPRLAAAGRRMATLLAHGTDYAPAGRRAGLFDEWQTRLINIAGESGTRATVLQRLSQRLDTALRHRRTQRAQMVYPLVLLVAAVFIGPVPPLVLGQIDGLQYLALTVGTLLRLLLLLLVLRWAWRRTLAGQGQDSVLARRIGRQLLRVWRLGPITRQRMLRDYLEALGLQHHAGVPLFEALPQAREQVGNAWLRQRWKEIETQLEGGAPLAEAVRDQPGFHQAAEVIRAAETAGRLDDALLAYTARLSEDLALEDASTARWLPRIAYAVIVLAVVSGLLG